MKALILTLVLACPYCAQKDDPNSARTWAVVGSMIAFPFALAAVAITAVRRMDRDSR